MLCKASKNSKKNSKMKSNFEHDCTMAGEIVHFVYETIFLGEDALDYDEADVSLIDFDKDPDMQFAGADMVIFPGTKKARNIEIKAAINSAGKKLVNGKQQSLSTFAHEISYLNEQGIVRSGWLVDEAKESNIYVLCWFPEVQKQNEQGYTRLKTIVDIKKMDIAIIEVTAVQDMLVDELRKQESIDDFNDVRQYLIDKSSDMRKHNRKTDKFGSYTMLLSSQMQEQPINLLIPKTVLIEKACRSYTIRRKDTSSTESIEWVTIPFK